MQELFKVGDRVSHYLKKIQGRVIATNVVVTRKGRMFNNLIQVKWDNKEPTLQGVSTLRLISRPAFAIGDRVVGKLSARHGVVSDINADGMFGIKWDTNHLVIGWNHARYLERENPLVAAQEPEFDSSITNTFRKNPTNRRWETSYTKRVIDAIIESWGEFADVDPEERAAISLLEDYWKTLHVPYEQRDEARAEVAKLELELQTAKQQLDDALQVNTVLRKEIVSAREQVAKLAKAADAGVLTNSRLALVDEFQNFFRCKHYPIALSNWVRGRTTCTLGCHLTDLKWSDNGTHRELEQQGLNMCQGK